MFQVASNSGKNRLYITLAGYLEEPERKAAMKAVVAEAGTLRPGFDVISDISGLHPSNQEGFKDLLRTRSALKLKGVGRVIRVVKIPLSRIQLARVSEAAGYDAEEVESLEAAEQLLDVPDEKLPPEG